ncbi:MAG: right-handed parallel beta-helix repeat-containing protein [Verrucomicrobia bacterium]|nr:right-handed parallel beta-helix repeat-containing protein [Verrucomicrobiota bacterium]
MRVTLLLAGMAHPEIPPEPLNITDFGAVSDVNTNQTEAIQKAIDTAAANGGGLVTFPDGEFVVSRLVLRDDVYLHLSENTVLRGAEDWEEYRDEGWISALVRGDGIQNTGILGEGVIDGQNVGRPGGEEGFRGPHIVHLRDSRNIRIEGITFRNSGNYAMLFRDCETISIQDVTVLGGHDGVHIQACQNVSILNGDFRTGDDCIAGTDNKHVTVKNSRFNTACNAFRLGAVHLHVADCHFQGPGEFPHLVTVRRGNPRYTMGAAFVHFSPRDRNPQLPSDHWLIENCTMDQVGAVYAYNHARGLWQQGQPAKNLRFKIIKATEVRQPIRIIGDEERNLHLHLENMSISLSQDGPAQPVIDIQRFGTLRLENVRLQNHHPDTPALRVRNGDSLTLHTVSPGQAAWEIGDVNEFSMED